MSLNKELEARLKSIEDLAFQSLEISKENSSTSIAQAARIMALCSMIEDLASRMGVDRADLNKHFALRIRWYHDRLLRHVEDASPGAAALLDPRTIEEASVPLRFPSLFDDPLKSQE